ncbi:MAG: hypothetical protein OEO77_06825 [Acidimicrobiia bacterium]|nr:hypothetical protein [Acidimicrobiia bacterium]
MAYGWDVEAMLRLARKLDRAAREIQVVCEATGTVLARVSRYSESCARLGRTIDEIDRRESDVQRRSLALLQAGHALRPEEPARIAPGGIVSVTADQWWDWRRAEYMAREYVLYRNTNPDFLARYGRDGAVAAAALAELDALDLLADDVAAPASPGWEWLRDDPQFWNLVAMLADDLGRLEQDKWMALLGGMTASMGDTSDLAISGLMARSVADGWIDESKLRIGYPHGFDSHDAFDEAAAVFRTAAAADGVRVGVRGSAASGISYHRGIVGSDIGDIDFFIVSDEAFARGVAAGARPSKGALRLKATLDYFPDLVAVERKLRAQTGYDVTVRIFSVDGFDNVRSSFEVFGR